MKFGTCTIDWNIPYTLNNTSHDNPGKNIYNNTLNIPKSSEEFSQIGGALITGVIPLFPWKVTITFWQEYIPQTLTKSL